MAHKKVWKTCSVCRMKIEVIEDAIQCEFCGSNKELMDQAKRMGKGKIL